MYACIPGTHAAGFSTVTVRGGNRLCLNRGRVGGNGGRVRRGGGAAVRATESKVKIGTGVGAVL